MKNRRGLSVTRDTDIQASEWPVATASLLQDHMRLESSHDTSQINQPLFALIRARKAIGDARLACRYAKKFNVQNPNVCERLDSINKALEVELHRFPMTVRNS